MKNHIYIAYGSNMNTLQMDRRCPSSYKIATGVLHGYELAFCGNKRGNNYATIIKKHGASTPVLLWVTPPYDERSLDMYEGYPDFYRKEIISVTDIELDVLYKAVKIKDAYVYIMNSDTFGKPSNSYFYGILNAYVDLGIDTKPLFDAYRRSAGHSFRFCR